MRRMTRLSGSREDVALVSRHDTQSLKSYAKASMAGALEGDS